MPACGLSGLEQAGTNTTKMASKRGGKNSGLIFGHITKRKSTIVCPRVRKQPPTKVDGHLERSSMVLVELSSPSCLTEMSSPPPKGRDELHGISGIFCQWSQPPPRREFFTFFLCTATPDSLPLFLRPLRISRQSLRPIRPTIHPKRGLGFGSN